MKAEEIYKSEKCDFNCENCQIKNLCYSIDNIPKKDVARIYLGK